MTQEYMRRVPSYDEMKKLQQMLLDAGIPHSYKVDKFDDSEIKEEWHDIKIPSRESFFRERGFSIILNGGSYGHESGLLEVWWKPGMEYPEGRFTAEAVFQMIMNHKESWCDA